MSVQEKRKLRQERGERNHIEGKFGEGKTKYGLNKILAKLPDTYESWVNAIFFVVNIRKWMRDIFVPYFLRLFFQKKHPLLSIFYPKVDMTPNWSCVI